MSARFGFSSTSGQRGSRTPTKWTLRKKMLHIRKQFFKRYNDRKLVLKKVDRLINVYEKSELKRWLAFEE